MLKGETDDYKVKKKKTGKQSNPPLGGWEKKDQNPRERKMQQLMVSWQVDVWQLYCQTAGNYVPPSWKLQLFMFILLNQTFWQCIYSIGHPPRHNKLSLARDKLYSTFRCN